MLQGCSPSHDWLCESEPLLFDDEFCQSLMKDLQAIPTPPQSPPMKPGYGKSLSTVDQLELVSELLMEDSDFLRLDWNCDFTGASIAAVAAAADDPLSEDYLWHTDGDKPIEDKLASVLSTSPLLSDIDTQIFAEIVGSTLDCHNVALACQALESEDLPLDSQEQIESTSDYGSLSTGGESSTSDSEEEIDVVTVRRSSTLTRSQRQQQLEDSHREQQRALKRCHFEIQQQHNYAAPRPASPPPLPSPSTAPPLKRSRGAGESHRNTHSSGRSRSLASRQSADTEDEEERRRTHNVMERQRRNELKNCFFRLRDNVPELSKNEKASKVVILKRAKESIRNLESENQRLAQKRDKLRQRQEQLRARLEQLKRL
ncbi:transcriptional regulator Myc-2-like [Myxocyprinus asiaticus]|uniref:transcriptional regulator Myc-2-like n=1 Tax=Myxocyprinus asiaticus TaxID=70543 RepID=UPI00222364D2|nr:transcriptional regulator Myc-2-like [Myxocyprinus asiaticus]XP_051562454.1 transcriptional regulator Myc-2-like [Myxocyprinus asiaticus]